MESTLTKYLLRKLFHLSLNKRDFEYFLDFDRDHTLKSFKVFKYEN